MKGVAPPKVRNSMQPKAKAKELSVRVTSA